MICFIHGSPGSGKSTHARLLAERYGFQVVSSGALIRAATQDIDQAEVQRVKSGQLIASEYVNRLVFNRIDEIGAESLILIDGYPRKLQEAKLFVSKYKKQIAIVFNLQIDQAETKRRLQKRGRDDDDMQSVLLRFRIFSQKQPIIHDYFSSQGIEVCNIDASGKREKTYQLLRQKLEAFQPELA